MQGHRTCRELAHCVLVEAYGLANMAFVLKRVGVTGQVLKGTQNGTSGQEKAKHHQAGRQQ